MARSSKDDPIFNDNTWNYHADTGENCAPGGINEIKQTPMTGNPGVLPENIYGRANFTNDVYSKPFNVQNGDIATNKEDKISFNTMPNVNRMNRQNYGNAMLNLGNGQVVRVFYDKNNQQLIFPMSGQYELFNHNQNLCDVPLQSQPSHLFTLNQNQEFTANNNVHVSPSTATIQPGSYNSENGNQTSNKQTSNFLKEVLGNWEPNSSGTYSPFGQNYPLNHPDAPTISTNIPTVEPIMTQIKPENSPKRNETVPLSDTSNKKRIVAEVKPMRPSYSDVLAKNSKNSLSESAKKVNSQNIIENKTPNKPTLKPEKTNNIKHINEEKLKNEKKSHTNTISSGSESGDINTDETEKYQKANKKSKNKRNNVSRKWSSLDDITSEEGNFNQENESQFVFIKNGSGKSVKKEKKHDKPKDDDDKSADEDDSFKFEDDEMNSEFILQEGPNDGMKVRKKRDKYHHKISKSLQDKKKVNQTKLRKNKPGYMGLVQSYLEHWGEASWKAIIWFLYLLSDICRMSLHLSFDLCTSVFTQTYVSSQAVWRSSKEWLLKLAENKYLMYIDRKFGHTQFAFWRRLKWFKKEIESDAENESKLNSNIPLPATGEEAMKRLLACKGKDPYSILGVSVTCTDDEIKRYYRRQAFLVHPDKNQQPGAEEAFKILQHAFDLIGEPERREAYERRAQESRHAEAAWGELSVLLEQLHDKMEFAANTIRCTNCGRRHKRVATARPCYAARYCAQCKIRHSAKEGDIWAESSMMGLLVMYYACMDGAVYQITQWASCQKRNLKQLRPDCHVVQYRIVLGNKAAASDPQRPTTGHDPNLEEFLNNLYSKSGASHNTSSSKSPPNDADTKKRRNKKPKV